MTLRFETDEPSEIASLVGDLDLARVVAYSEPAVLLAHRLAVRMGLPHNARLRPESVRNKTLMRDLLRSAGLPQPRTLLTTTAVTCLGIDDGVCHIEFRESEHGPVIIEIANRVPAGGIPQIVEWASGVRIEESTLWIARASAASPVRAAVSGATRVRECTSRRIRRSGFPTTPPSSSPSSAPGPHAATDAPPRLRSWWACPSSAPTMSGRSRSPYGPPPGGWSRRIPRDGRRSGPPRDADPRSPQLPSVPAATAAPTR